ncbi:DUF4258 domain-containing protein [Candidatus Poriferisodalis sp.]|uniref:DUF4258 domain-containing protein n=1 Tax=Candidatus Poriferisodalis sp. TaxID=3101277 RepID=UPI003B02D057
MPQDVLDQPAIGHYPTPNGDLAPQPVQAIVHATKLYPGRSWPCCCKFAGNGGLVPEGWGPVASLSYTAHTQQVMAQRRIRHAWVERAVAAPVRRTRDPYDEAVERFFLRIAKRDGRVLRVAVKTESEPWRVVSAFFDRSARGNA